VVIQLHRPIPCLPGGRERPGWAKDQACRVRAGLYETPPPCVREAYVAAQVGRIVGWHFAAWDGTTPTAVQLYVEVHHVTEA
jgi:hypothetical protein